MKKKLNCILLIDDDEPTNFIHKMVIEDSNCAEHVVAKESGEAALNYLRSSVDGVFPQPDLIFLDINMPSMNGWEFLEHYEELSDEIKGRVIIVMLTTSLNPDDMSLSKDKRDITSFLNKPLTIQQLSEIVEKYFPDYL